MARKRYQAEEIIRKLRAIEVHMAKGLKAEEASRKEEIAEQTHYRWRREYGGLKIDQAKRLKELERENARLKKLLAEAGSRIILPLAGSGTDSGLQRTPETG